MKVSEGRSDFIQFSRPTLSNLSFISKDKKQVDSTYINNMEITTKLTKVIDVKENPKLNEGEVILTVKNFNDAEKAIKNREIPYLLNISMKSFFRWQKNLTDDELKKLIQVNAASLLFSYIRPIVSSITSESEFKQEDLPFIDFTKSKEN